MNTTASLSVLVLSLSTGIASLEEAVKTNVRSSFDTLSRVQTRRPYGRTTEAERQAFRIFVKHGISREEVAVKFNVSFQTVRNYTGANNS